MPALRSKRVGNVVEEAKVLPVEQESQTSRFFNPIPANSRILKDEKPKSPTENAGSVYYPREATERRRYITDTGKSLSQHQWSVYDFILTIPHGRVTTYKDVALAVGGSPRSVGGALRSNPFSPYVPCHRVIATSLFVGGFFGEWGKQDKTGTRYNQKVALLGEEGVFFDSKGHLSNSDQCLWSP